MGTGLLIGDFRDLINSSNIPLYVAPRFLEWGIDFSDCQELRYGYDRATGSGTDRLLAPATSGTARNRFPITTAVGPLASTTSVTVRNRVPVMTRFYSVFSATARNRVPATTGPPAPATAGPLGSATSAMATGLSVSVGSAIPIMAISLFVTLIESVLARDRSSSLSVGACGVDCIPAIFRGVNFSARAERGGHYGLLDSPRPSITVPSRSTSVVLGPVDPLVLPVVLCASKDGNS